MHVQHEARDPQRPGAHPAQRADIQGLEDRVDADALPVAQGMVAAHRPAVGQDQVDLRVGNPEGLDEELHAVPRVERRREVPLAPFGLEEETELFVEPEGDGGVAGAHSADRRSIISRIRLARDRSRRLVHRGLEWQISWKSSFENTSASTGPLVMTVAERTDLSKKLISPISSPVTWMRRYP